MGYNYSWVKRLYFNIQKGKFDWKRYLEPKPYYGVMICTTPLHNDTSCRNVCGYVISFPYQKHKDITIDWDMETIKLGDKEMVIDRLTSQVKFK